jgi:hypothetical protein
MRPLILILMSSFSLFAQAQTKTEIERINFFPSSDAFAEVQYHYEKLNIETPQTSVNTKEVNNFSNLLSISYAQKFHRKIFLGISGIFEEASENAVIYGIPLRRRFNSFGPKEPLIFGIFRLREQADSKGLVDLYVSFAPDGGGREIGKDKANRLRGRHLLHLILSHGMREGDWEFKSSLDYLYWGEGEERNAFLVKKFILEDYYNLSFHFKTQYRINDWLFASSSIGAVYHSTQTIIDKHYERRQIQSGTGSVFEFGLKRPLSDWSVIELSYTHKRNDYFVKSPDINLNGEQKVERFILKLVHAF